MDAGLRGGYTEGMRTLLLAAALLLAGLSRAEAKHSCCKPKRMPDCCVSAVPAPTPAAPSRVETPAASAAAAPRSVVASVPVRAPLLVFVPPASPAASLPRGPPAALA